MSGVKFPNIKKSELLYASGRIGLKSANTLSCVSRVSREFMSLWYRPAQKNDFSPFFTSSPAKSILRLVKSCKTLSGKSSPTTETILTCSAKYEAAKEM